MSLGSRRKSCSLDNWHVKNISVHRRRESAENYFLSFPENKRRGGELQDFINNAMKIELIFTVVLTVSATSKG